ncbi:MAG: nucleoside-diphosphate kinase [Fimbriimonadales bacterium]|nr:nucleoside-diphosphate kinase [Fimbriimonadales bacterium]
MSQTTRTLVFVKPDGVRRGLVGEIIQRFEKRGIRIVGLKMVHPTRELAEKHYAVHRDKPFFEGVVNFITSGPVVAMVLECPNAIEVTRQMMGATNPINAAPGTIRGDFGLDIEQNIIHGSSDPEAAEYELNLWFKPEELVGQ